MQYYTRLHAPTRSPTHGATDSTAVIAAAAAESSDRSASIFRIDFPFVCVTQPPSPRPSVRPSTRRRRRRRKRIGNGRCHSSGDVASIVVRRCVRVRPPVAPPCSPLCRMSERADGRVKKRRKRSERSLTRASAVLLVADASSSVCACLLPRCPLAVVTKRS